MAVHWSSTLSKPAGPAEVAGDIQLQEMGHRGGPSHGAPGHRAPTRRRRPPIHCHGRLLGSYRPAVRGSQVVRLSRSGPGLHPVPLHLAAGDLLGFSRLRLTFFFFHKATDPNNAWLGGGEARAAYREWAAAMAEGRPLISFEWQLRLPQLPPRRPPRDLVRHGSSPSAVGIGLLMGLLTGVAAFGVS